MMLKRGGDDSKCPPGVADFLFAPRSHMAQQVHQLLKKGKLTRMIKTYLCQKD
jgi:hypothetical protein